jgi:hypothetical protein
VSLLLFSSLWAEEVPVDMAFGEGRFGIVRDKRNGERVVDMHTGVLVCHTASKPLLTCFQSRMVVLSRHNGEK